MIKLSKTVWLLLLVILIALIHASFFTIFQGQQGVILRMGHLLTTNDGKVWLAQPGLHFNWPLLEHVEKFDMRLQSDTAQSSRIYIEKENYVMVDYYVKWRINDLSLFYTSIGIDTHRAETLIEQKIDTELRGQFGTRNLQMVVQQDQNSLDAQLKSQATLGVRDLGVSIEDVRLQAIYLPPNARQYVFDIMRADRQALAASYRADGKKQAIVIKANADAQRITILATAQKQVDEILAKGAATAAKIYADAYSKDDKFYQFFQSMLAYRAAFAHKNTLLVLRPEGSFFKYFNPGTANSADVNK